MIDGVRHLMFSRAKQGVRGLAHCEQAYRKPNDDSLWLLDIPVGRPSLGQVTCMSCIVTGDAPDEGTTNPHGEMCLPFK